MSLHIIHFWALSGTRCTTYYAVILGAVISVEIGAVHRSVTHCYDPGHVVSVAIRLLQVSTSRTLNLMSLTSKSAINHRHCVGICSKPYCQKK